MTAQECLTSSRNMNPKFVSRLHFALTCFTLGLPCHCANVDVPRHSKILPFSQMFFFCSSSSNRNFVSSHNSFDSDDDDSDDNSEQLDHDYDLTAGRAGKKAVNKGRWTKEEVLCW